MPARGRPLQPRRGPCSGKQTIQAQALQPRQSRDGILQRTRDSVPHPRERPPAQRAQMRGPVPVQDIDQTAGWNQQRRRSRAEAAPVRGIRRRDRDPGPEPCSDRCARPANPCATGVTPRAADTVWRCAALCEWPAWQARSAHASVHGRRPDYRPERTGRSVRLWFVRTTKHPIISRSKRENLEAVGSESLDRVGACTRGSLPCKWITYAGGTHGRTERPSRLPRPLRLLALRSRSGRPRRRRLRAGWFRAGRAGGRWSARATGQDPCPSG